MSPVLVFGGGGQLGQDLIRSALSRSMPLHALSGADANIADRAGVEAALSRYRPGLVVNAAAYTKVDDAESEREAADLANALGPGILAQACKAADVSLVHVSTDYVFDGTKRGAYVESDPVAPTGYYGASKARGEDAVREGIERHFILRTSWLFGEFGKNFLKTMLRLAGERDEIAVVSDQHGCPTSTRDLANAILKIAASKSSAHGTYHFAGTGVTSWHGFASLAIAKYAALTGRKVSVRAITTAEYPARTRRPANSVLDCSKFERTFGFRGQPWEKEVSEITEILVGEQLGANGSKGAAHA